MRSSTPGPSGSSIDFFDATLCKSPPGARQPVMTAPVSDATATQKVEIGFFSVQEPAVNRWPA
jgi:hypothetical protein